MLLPAAGLPRQGMRNLYTTLCKLAETLEHLMHLFFLFFSRAMLLWRSRLERISKP
jgi:hypothetical protein